MKFPRLYILVGQTPVPEPNWLKWAEWFGAADRIVFQTEIPGGVISTVFLGLDHQYGKGPPLLFETMAFIDGEAAECRRTSTWLEAEAKHHEMVGQAVKR